MCRKPLYSCLLDQKKISNKGPPKVGFMALKIRFFSRSIVLPAPVGMIVQELIFHINSKAKKKSKQRIKGVKFDGRNWCEFFKIVKSPKFRSLFNKPNTLICMAINRQMTPSSTNNHIQIILWHYQQALTSFMMSLLKHHYRRSAPNNTHFHGTYTHQKQEEFREWQKKHL